MNFLRDWLTRWLPSLDKAQTKQDGPVVTRFIINRSLRLKEAGFRLKTVAFLPKATESGRLELSVFRIDDLGEEDVWELALKHVVPSGRNVHGRGDLKRTQIETTEPPLRLAMDEKPPRHGSVVDWPDAKDERLALAQALVARARHVEPQDF